MGPMGPEEEFPMYPLGTRPKKALGCEERGDLHPQHKQEYQSLRESLGPISRWYLGRTSRGPFLILQCLSHQQRCYQWHQSLEVPVPQAQIGELV